LTGRCEYPCDATIDRAFDVGVGEDDIRRFAAELQRDGLQPFCGGTVDGEAAGLAAGERDFCHKRMRDEGRANLGGKARHGVYDA
jgi:hypothetical protein